MADAIHITRRLTLKLLPCIAAAVAVSTKSTPAAEPARRMSGMEWLDDILTKQMADELRKRGADDADPAGVRAALKAANFGEPSIERLADAAVIAAKDLRDAA
ncbi:hypothetical protein [Mesorhizobium sp. KR1-2]|uniref:hypothetical protein n=1 Tax=Mesorhizobium sp. KR1-2 TaxID=3156609 RepID=UPI0032B3CC8B